MNEAARAAFIDKMVGQHGFDRAELTSLLDAAVIDQTILDAMARPAERVVPWFEYRNIFLTEERIAAGVAFLDRARRDASSESPSATVSRPR